MNGCPKCGGKTVIQDVHRAPRPRPEGKEPCSEGRHVHLTCLYCNHETVEDLS